MRRRAWFFVRDIYWSIEQKVNPGQSRVTGNCGIRSFACSGTEHPEAGIWEEQVLGGDDGDDG